jgi:tetratricopeptide (TPR) repeat protein
MERPHLATRARAWIVLFSGVFGTALTSVPAVAEPLRLAQVSESDPAAMPVLKQAEALLAEHKAREAYELLSANELDLGGTALFDYLLGVAALDSGRANDAAFALERVIATQPDFSGARMELARAEFERGEYSLARTQFQYLLTQSPPSQTQAVIERYLTAIDKRSTLAGSRWSALAQFGAGYDTNANGSTNEQTFLGFTLNPRNVETESSFGELTLGVGNTVALGAQSGLISNFEVSHRANPDASFIDQTVATLGTGVVWAHGSTRFSAGVDGYAGWLDGEDHEHGANLNLGVSHRWGDYEGGLSVRGGTIEYEQPALEILDTNRYLGGFSFTRLNIGERSGRIGVALLGGTDDAKHDGSPYGNDRYGARAFASWLLRPQSSIYLEVSRMSTDYDGAFFGVDRTDDLTAATVALDLQNFPAAKWSVAPRVRYMKNDSSVSLYEYDRVEAVIFVRRSF